jgi:hypothetical protein
MNIWNKFTLREEYHKGIRDVFNRFPYYMSSNRDIFRPIVSEYLFKKGFEPEYPNNKSFAVCLSHDIDTLFSTRMSKLKKVIRSNQKNITYFSNLLSNKIDSDLDVKNIIFVEQAFDATSSFYFLSLEKEDPDFNYKVEDIAEQFDLIKNSGSEIGLHGGHDAYNSGLRMALEKEKLETILNNKITGYRGHYLRFITPNTWEKLSETDFVYDTTLSFSDCAGFRNGMCYPFRPFSLDKNCFIDIIEVPLIIMDACLFVNMKLSIKSAFQLCEELIEKVEKVSGVITILWHNNYMSGEYKLFYEGLLNLLNKKNAWMTSTKTLVEYWSKKGYTQEIERIIESLSYEFKC